MLVAVDDDGVALALGDRNRRDLRGEAAIALRGGGAALALGRESILILAAYTEFLGHILGRLGHRIDAELRLHQLVDEAPADRRVVHLGLAIEGAGRLGDDEGRAAHALDAAGDDQAALPAADRPRRHRDRIEAGAAEPVQRHAARRLRQPGEQPRHARDVAIVLARLVGAAVDHILDRPPIDAWIAFDQRPDRVRGEIVGADRREAAAIASDRGPDRIADIGLGHQQAPTHPLGTNEVCKGTVAG